MTTIIIIDFLTAAPLIYSPSKFGKQILTLSLSDLGLEIPTLNTGQLSQKKLKKRKLESKVVQYSNTKYKNFKFI